MACDDCTDGDGGNVYPYFGLAPHTHKPGKVIMGTEFLPETEWPKNYSPDPEDPRSGTYTHCLSCGAFRE